MSATPSYTSIPLDDFETVFGSTSTEVSSVALGGKILDVSDDFFAPFVLLSLFSICTH